MNETFEMDLVIGKIYELGTEAAPVQGRFAEYAEDEAPRFIPIGQSFPFRTNPKGFIEFDPRPLHIWYESPNTQDHAKEPG